MELTIYADGSCFTQAGQITRGGWAFIVTDKDGKEIYQEFGKLRKGMQTSIRAELEAVLRSLEYAIKNDNKNHFIIYTDSEAVADGINGIAVRNANRDIWEEIEYMCSLLIGKLKVEHMKNNKSNNIDLQYVLNNKTDKLAKRGANSLLIAPVLPINNKILEAI